MLPDTRPPTITPASPAIPIILLIPNDRPPLVLGSATLPELAGALPIDLFPAPSVVKGFVEEAKPAVIDDCVPIVKATQVRQADRAKPRVAVAKPDVKVKPSIFADIVKPKNTKFSEQIKLAKKRFAPPANVVPRLVDKNC